MALEQEDKILLVRIDERVGAICKRLESGDRRMDETDKKADLLERRVSSFPCAERDVRISRLEKLTYGAIAAMLLMIAKTMWGMVTGIPVK